MGLRSGFAGRWRGGTIGRPEAAVLRVLDLQVIDKRTALICEGSEGITTVMLPAVPVVHQANMWRRVMRIDRVEVCIDGSNCTATIVGLNHRLPARRGIPISVAVALLADGIIGRVLVFSEASQNG